MKKLLSLLLVVSMSVTLFGCGNSEEKVPETTVTESGETINLGNEDTYSVLKNVDFTSTISTETDRVQKSLAIDAQVQDVLDSGNYTFENLKDSDIIVNAYGNSPLTALALFNTDKECKVKVTVKGDHDYTDVTGEVSELSKSHRVPIVGLYANRTNKVVIELLDANNDTIDKRTFKVKTDPLPTKLDGAVTVYKHQAKSAYGLIEVSGFGTPYIYAFDEAGQVRWYLNEKYACYGYYPLTNGHFLWMDGNDMIQTPEKPHAQNMYETDYLGRVYQIFYVQKGLHHEIIEKTPGGNLLVATSSLENHFEETIQEIDRSSGEVVKTLKMDAIYGDTHIDELDWAHINTVSYNEEDDTVVVSTRNVHTVVKFNWTTNEIVWLLGHPSVWKGTDIEKYSLKAVGDDFDWQFQQHTSYITDTDLDGDPNTVELGLYDNHWQKDAPIKEHFTDRPDSYVKFYSINEKDMTVELIHEYACVKSRITSGWQADFEAKRVFAMCGYIADRKANNGMKGMFYEYDYDTEGVLNQYASKYTYYRAYEFEINLDSCNKSLAVADNYFCGTVNQPDKDLFKSSIPEETLDTPDLSMTILGNILKINSFDHSVSKVEFVGKKNSYTHTFDYNGKGEKKFEKLAYNISMSFQNLEPDEYTVVLTYYGERLSTGQTITIK